MKNNIIKKLAQNAPINELYDFFDDNTIDDYQDSQPSTVVDFDNINKDIGEDEEDLIIDPQSWEDYLADNNLEEDEIKIETPEEQDDIEPFVDNEDVPLEVTDEEIPEFSNTEEAMHWAIENGEVVRINYKTQGKRRGGRRKGIILKRELNLSPGQEIVRIVEPHHMYIAGTGNLILVTYDRSVRAIRAFIVDNILNYIFTGKEFKERMRVLPSKEKGENMTISNNLFNNLKELGDNLDSRGLEKSASFITSTMEDLLKVKTAQYVGSQGYWIRQKRCWDNCYRQKRASTPDKPAQRVWGECWDEYLESLKDPWSGWEKYANDSKNILKTASSEQKKVFIDESEKFIKTVKNKLASGKDLGIAVYSTIESQKKENEEVILSRAVSLSKLASKLNDNGYNELSVKVANISVDLLKEAGLWDGVKNTFKGIGQGVKDWWGSKQVGKVSEQIQEVLQDIEQILSTWNNAAVNRKFNNPANKAANVQLNNIYKVAQNPPMQDENGQWYYPGNNQGQTNVQTPNTQQSPNVQNQNPTQQKRYSPQQVQFAKSYYALKQKLLSVSRSLGTLAQNSKNQSVRNMVQKALNTISNFNSQNDGNIGQAIERLKNLHTTLSYVNAQMDIVPNQQGEQPSQEGDSTQAEQLLKNLRYMIQNNPEAVMEHSDLARSIGSQLMNKFRRKKTKK